VYTEVVFLSVLGLAVMSLAAAQETAAPPTPGAKTPSSSTPTSATTLTTRGAGPAAQVARVGPQDGRHRPGRHGVSREDRRQAARGGERTDVAVGVGIRQNQRGGRQASWVADYDLAQYPGKVHEDGVTALIDTIMASPQPITLICIGPMPKSGPLSPGNPRSPGRRASWACTAVSARATAAAPSPRPSTT